MRASKRELAQQSSNAVSPSGEPATIQSANWGDMVAAFWTVPQGVDFEPVFEGIANDNCPVRHWGYVVRGRIHVKYDDHEEVCSAGDMFYWPPNHMPVFEEDTEFIEFRPKSDEDDLLKARAAKNSGIEDTDSDHP